MSGIHEVKYDVLRTCRKHTQTSKENEIIFHLACPKSWVLHLIIWTKRLESVERVVDWTFEVWTTILWLLFVFMEKPSSSLFSERNQNGKNRFFLLFLKTLKNPWFSWKNQWFLWLILSLFRLIWELWLYLTTSSMAFVFGEITLMNPKNHPDSCPTLDLTSNSSSFRLEIHFGMGNLPI